MLGRKSGDVLKGKTHDPIHCAVLYNGWLAGVFSPAGGWIAAGEGANENTFIAACKAQFPKEG